MRKPPSAETKAKMSASHTGKKLSQAHKDAMRAAWAAKRALKPVAPPKPKKPEMSVHKSKQIRRFEKIAQMSDLLFRQADGTVVTIHRSVLEGDVGPNAYIIRRQRVCSFEEQTERNLRKLAALELSTKNE